jgi:hypothetical protein
LIYDTKTLFSLVTPKQAFLLLLYLQVVLSSEISEIRYPYIIFLASMGLLEQQCDSIQAPYDYIRGASIALIERKNIHETVEPFIKKARILELACGSRFYTYSSLS